MLIKTLRIIAAFCLCFFIQSISFAQNNEANPSNKTEVKQDEKAKKDAERLAKEKAKFEEKQKAQAAKDEKRRQKQAEKERLERPAQITINASAERVRSSIVARAASNGSIIEEATDYKIVFSKRITGMKGAFTQALLGNAYSEEPKYVATMILAEIEKGKTLVTMSDVAITVRMALGNVNRVDYTKDKKVRAEADAMLQQLKQFAESQEQEAAKKNEVVSQSTPTQQPAQTVLSAEGYNQAGVGLFGQKKYSEAEIAFREAVRLDPYNAAFHYNLGTSLNAQNKFDEAEKEIELACRLAPNEEMYKRSLEAVRANKVPRN